MPVLERLLTKGRLFSFNSTQNPIKLGSSYFFPVGMFNANQENYLKDFLEIPELNAVLNIRARAMASAKFEIVSKTTGEEQPNHESLVKILRQPNWFQGKEEFWKQTSLYRDIYGNGYIYFLTPVGMPNSYKGMFTIPPPGIEVTYDQDQPYFHIATGDSLKYTFTFNEQKYPIDKENLIHLNDNRVDPENIVLGTSKLKSLQPAIQNIRAAYRKRNIALNMPIGIISNGNTGDAIGTVVPMDEKEKQNAQLALESHGSLPIFTNMAIGYNDMTINPSNMGLFDETIEDTGRICDAFGVPYKLLSSAKAGTLNNSGGELRESRKQMYEDSIIPDMDEWITALNDMVESNKRSWQIVAKWDHLPVFSEDIKQRATTLKMTTDALSRALADGAITVEQYQQELTRFGI